ncbi:phosphorylase b kinase gamma catalytic chain, skeletal muscle/heart isoform isoform X2 [Coccinella septempunctata]|uniref:phosphorylase b kinase gamma catalytic chain, skeletal muscle/heart isoform isoform X2 n=1 Tax=Coccinella septempunctata TaxID=41139 RepID=UPI001D063BC4|nr:phosphorylase b kinase gamma catalytic chain, skeletal muscle/heart isoform isoform X2 [Coccinella septempunctata]
MAKDEEDDKLPDKHAAKEFYAKYEPKEILGRGISSTVRRCIDKETGKEYAAKIIDLSTDNSDGMSLDATRQEIAILRLVAGHSYIIELQDVFESPTFIFLVFELCKNGELFDYLTSVVALSEKKTRYIMKQIFEGVSHIHSKSVVHRDLKPENILLDDNLNVKITDFGFAKQILAGEELHDLCGTPGYLAPETLKCNMIEDAPGYSYEVDAWACGVIMYTLLVGCPPFWHRKQMVMLRNIMEAKFSFSSPEWNDISDAPKDLICKLLVVDPKKRLSVDEALKHPFFHTVNIHHRVFDPRQKFKWAIKVVQAVVRIQRLKYTPEPLSVETAKIDPYTMRLLRKVVDGCAFRVYGHWVKKGEGQNRAALFENYPKTDLKQIYVNNLNNCT